MNKTVQKSGIVRLGFSPYTYARVAVMKSSLLRREDLDRLLKMGPQEILRFLQDSGYRQEIDQYNVVSGGLRVIEKALNQNLFRSVQKLFRISYEKMRKVLSMYLWRYDLENFKMILRSKFTQTPSAEIKEQLYSSVNYSLEFFRRLLEKNTVQEVIYHLPFLRQEKINFHNLFEIENALDRYYMKTFYEFATHLKGQGKTVAQFFRQEIEMINLKTILRGKSASGELAQAKNLEKYVLYPSELIKKIMLKDSFSEIVKLLRSQKLTTLHGEEEDLLLKLEMEMSVYLLRKENLLIHQHLLSANYILGYLFAKENEVRNLQIIFKGKSLALKPEYLEQLLVIAA